MKPYTKNGNIGVSVSYSTVINDLSLFFLHKKRVTSLLGKGVRNKNDILDALISLHLVLEVGINAFFQHFLLMNHLGSVKKDVIIENLDTISFKDKVATFIYFGKFDFKEEFSAVETNHKIIGKIKKFCEVRNHLLHGHMSGVFSSEGKKSETKTYKLITEECLQTQIQDFKSIFDSLWFFLEHLDSSITMSGRESFKKEFLDTDFLNI